MDTKLASRLMLFYLAVSSGAGWAAARIDLGPPLEHAAVSPDGPRLGFDVEVTTAYSPPYRVEYHENPEVSEFLRRIPQWHAAGHGYCLVSRSDG